MNESSKGVSKSEIKNMIISAANACEPQKFNRDEFDPSYVRELNSVINKYLKTANPKDIRIYIDIDGLYDLGFEEDNITQFVAANKIKFVDSYTLYTMRDKIKDPQGVDDFIRRESSIWNDKYLYTGSDGTWYIMAEKVA